MATATPDMQTRLRAAAMKKNPSRFFVPNGKQERFLRLVGGGKYGVVVFLGGNGSGKTAVGANTLAQITYGAHGSWTRSCPLYEAWPYPKRAG